MFQVTFLKVYAEVFKKIYAPGGHIRIFKKAFFEECFKELNLKVFKYHREHAIHSIYWILKARNNMQEDKFLKSLHELLVKQMFGQAKIAFSLRKC